MATNVTAYTCMGCGVAAVAVRGRLCPDCAYARHESALVDYDSPSGGRRDPAVQPEPAPPALASLTAERVGEIWEFTSAVVRETEFVSIEVAVEFSDAGDAEVSARRVDNGARVDLRFEESEHFAIAAARGDYA
jgi:hypothetical protein